MQAIDWVILGVGVINASPISMGLLTNRGPPDWHPAVKFTPCIPDACSQAAKYCEERGVDISRLALHFSLELPDCATCLVSARLSGQENYFDPSQAHTLMIRASFTSEYLSTQWGL